MIRCWSGFSVRGDASYYFYRALLRYYLSTLNIKILRAAFGSNSDLPSTIMPRVENVATGYLVDDDFRKRAKDLVHLPYGCEIVFLECDCTDIVSAEILETFRVEIDQGKPQLERVLRKRVSGSKQRADMKKIVGPWLSTGMSYWRMMLHDHKIQS